MSHKCTTAPSMTAAWKRLLSSKRQKIFYNFQWSRSPELLRGLLYLPSQWGHLLLFKTINIKRQYIDMNYICICIFILYDCILYVILCNKHRYHKTTIIICASSPLDRDTTHAPMRFSWSSLSTEEAKSSQFTSWFFGQCKSHHRITFRFTDSVCLSRKRRDLRKHPVGILNGDNGSLAKLLGRQSLAAWSFEHPRSAAKGCPEGGSCSSSNKSTSSTWESQEDPKHG